MILLALAGAAAASEPLSPECSGMMAVAVAAAPRHDPSKPALANGVFLVADRDLQDPNFRQTVILVTQFDEAGTIGLVVNRRLPMPAIEALPALSNLERDPGSLHLGGPVRVDSLQILVRTAAPEAEGTLKILPGVQLVTRQEAFDALLAGRIEGDSIRVYAGYAGWGPGQLESELLRGDWYLVRAQATDVFTEAPETLWPELIERAAAKWAGIQPPSGLCGVPQRQYNAGKNNAVFGMTEERRPGPTRDKAPLTVFDTMEHPRSTDGFRIDTRHAG